MRLALIALLTAGCGATPAIVDGGILDSTGAADAVTADADSLCVKPLEGTWHFHFYVLGGDTLVCKPAVDYDIIPSQKQCNAACLCDSTFDNNSGLCTIPFSESCVFTNSTSQLDCMFSVDTSTSVFGNCTIVSQLLAQGTFITCTYGVVGRAL